MTLRVAPSSTGEVILQNPVLLRWYKVAVAVGAQRRARPQMLECYRYRCRLLSDTQELVVVENHPE